MKQLELQALTPLHPVTHPHIQSSQELPSLPKVPKLVTGLVDYSDEDDSEGFENSEDSDDEALVKLIARLKEKRQAEEKSAPKRVKAGAMKAVLTLGAVNLRGMTPVTRGRSKVTLEKAMEESKKTNKEREGFRIIDESDVEEVDLVSEDNSDEEEKEEKEALLQEKGKKKVESSEATPKEKSAKKRKATVSDP
ncbi:hypothetical protein A4A49_43851 [Nicotiana attenuata]|uniref:Uncharacterized protein n=1 Tax=Nicotiana attenuata TaxID=49451 RepID=A0A1J6IXL4_NICAT|nr:hypothetical protein A4A49_60716 [Nicotiana attenuata]OIT08996.1 hypothetical protein A4A49_43851 [Nicotiana attenuata]